MPTKPKHDHDDVDDAPAQRSGNASGISVEQPEPEAEVPEWRRIDNPSQPYKEVTPQIEAHTVVPVESPSVPSATEDPDPNPST